jgi:hypothetical protein
MSLEAPGLGAARVRGARGGGFGIVPGPLSLVVDGLLASFLVLRPRGLVGLAKSLAGLVTRRRRAAAVAEG